MKDQALDEPATRSTKPPTSLSKFIKHLPSTIYLLLIFSLGYTLGILNTSSSSNSDHPSSQSPRQSQIISSAPPHDLLKFRTKCADPIPQSQIINTITEKLFNGTSPFEGFPSAETASHLLPPSSRPRGWGSTEPVFRELIAAVRPRTIIELGTFLGASALHMASIAEELGLPTEILCVDDFRGWPGFRQRFRRDVPAPRNGDAMLMQQFMATVAAAGEGARRRVLPVPFSTASAMGAFCEWGVYGDLVEVDAGHDFHSAWADINMAWAVVRPGGILFGHDWHTVADERGVRRAVVLFAKVKGLEIRPNGQHWVLSPKPADGDGGRR